MSVSHLLEDFGAYALGTTGEQTEVLLEEERLEAFEKGYQAGWEDSANAQSQSTAHLSAEFTHTLKDLSFTYHEAYSGLLKGLRPLFKQMVASVLPRIAQKTIGLQVCQILQDLSEAHGKLPVHVHVASENLSPVKSIADHIEELPLVVEADKTLAPGQVRIRFDDVAESDIDIPRVLQEIDDAVAAYFDSDMNDLKDIA